MMHHLSKSILLMVFAVAICCGLYPLTLWAIGQTFFSDQANGSLVRDAAGTVVGSRLIAQPFTKDEYFHPRPSAPSYDASASAPSNLASSNYAPVPRRRHHRADCDLRERRAGRPARRTRRRGVVPEGHVPGTAARRRAVGRRAQQPRPGVGEGGPVTRAYVDEWSKADPAVVAQWVKDNPTRRATGGGPGSGVSTASERLPGPIPGRVSTRRPREDRGPPSSRRRTAATSSRRSSTCGGRGTAVALQDVPADFVMASGSGLDPHITLDNAKFQLDRIADAWAKDTKRSGAGAARHRGPRSRGHSGLCHRDRHDGPAEPVLRRSADETWWRSRRGMPVRRPERGRSQNHPGRRRGGPPHDMPQPELVFVIPTYRLRDVCETVATYDENFWNNGHSPRILVFDDSSVANHEKYYPLLEKTRTWATSSRRPEGRRRSATCSRGRATGSPAAVRNLFRPSYGGNRNFALIYTLAATSSAPTTTCGRTG
jgi:K+-transporting ATPase ATPase C chain